MEFMLGKKGCKIKVSWRRERREGVGSEFYIKLKYGSRSNLVKDMGW